MKRINLTILGCFLIGSIVGQEKKAFVWTEQSHVKKAIEFEKSIDKKCEFKQQNVSLSESIYPLVNKFNIENPVIVIRKKEKFLPLYAEYFFSESDSLLRYISYDWEKGKYDNFFDKQKIWGAESKKLEGYNSKYEDIKETLISQIGKPNEEDTKPVEKNSSSGRGNYLTRTTVWETETYYAKLSMIFESMTYRIRFYYYWKQ